MLPFAIPAGTTIETLLTRLLPAEHAARVSAKESTAPLVGVVLLGGDSPRAFTVTVRGNALDVREGEADKRDAWIWADGAGAEMFVREWSEGPRALVATKDAPIPTDPRLLRRVQMVNGRVELVLRDFAPKGGPPVRATVTIAAGSAAKKPIESGNADVTIETTAATFDDLVAGKLPADQALGDDRVIVQGKRLVAMQFALAFAPFFAPAR